MPEMVREEVVRITDDEVLEFIDRNYDPQSSTATRLLRLLRDQENKSCEQKRFGALFRAYKEKYGLNGGLFDVG